MCGALQWRTTRGALDSRAFLRQLGMILRQGRAGSPDVNPPVPSLVIRRPYLH
jgi:hypothetical protein